MNGKTIKVIGIVLSILGAAVSVATDIIGKKGQRAEIVDIVKEELARMKA